MPRASIPFFERPDGRELVERRCREWGIPLAVLEDLLKEVIDRGWMQRAAGLWSKFDEILDQLACSPEFNSADLDELFRELSSDVSPSS